MSPDTIEAVRCALQTVCETGGTMDELALIEQADRIADLEQQLSEMREERDSALSAESVLVEEREQAEQETARLRDMMGRVQSLEQQLSTLRKAAKKSMKGCVRCHGKVRYSGKDFEECVCNYCEDLTAAIKGQTSRKGRE